MRPRSTVLFLLASILLLIASLAAARADDFPPPAPRADEPVDDDADKRPGDDQEKPGAVSDAPVGETDARAAGDDLTAIEDDAGEPFRVDILGSRSIVGSDPVEAFRRIPGSGFTIDMKRLEKTRTPVSIQDSMRGQAGVNIRPEVNGGVVQNIGIRGLNPDRSERLLILEDGVLVGFAPYTVNAAYYIPPMERIARIELLKGSGQILYGPHSVGAVMNLITPEIPETTQGVVRLLGGSDGYLAPYIQAGTTRGAWGMLVTGLLKRGDGYRDFSDFDVRDAMVKLRRTWGRKSDLTLKGTFYESRTKNTYLGLTNGMFQMNPFQNPARHDTYDVDYTGGTLTFRHQPYTTHEYLVNVYASSGTRDWNRQDFARNTGFAAPPANTVATYGDTTIDGGALYMRSSFGSRDRDFFKLGIEPRMHGETQWGGRHEYDVGFRVHTEHFVNERNNRTAMAAAPTTRDRDVTRTNALAAWAHDTWDATCRLSVSGGVRLEYYESQRDFEIQGNAPVDFGGNTSTAVVIPGLGFTYDLGRQNTAFGGVHRGFAPPRTSDAVDSTGTDLDLDAEKSWNFELGARGTPKPWLSYEVAGFYMDFLNQVVPANESGGASTTDTNAGETLHVGVEAAASIEFLDAFSRSRRRASQPKLWFDASWTWLQTENTTPNGTYNGLELPYAPNHIGSFGLRAELPGQRLDIGCFAAYTGEQFTDQANTLLASNDGTRGVIPSYWVLDATIRWRIPCHRLTAMVSVNNLLDEVYIASRAPRGTFAGAYRHFFAGMELEF